MKAEFVKWRKIQNYLFFLCRKTNALEPRVPVAITRFRFLGTGPSGNRVPDTRVPPYSELKKKSMAKCRLFIKVIHPF